MPVTKRTLFIILFLYPICFGAAYSGSGDGNAASPYLITSWTQLQEMMDGNIPNRLSAYWKLTADIDAKDSYNLDGGKGWTPVGDHDFASFTGSFDGGGHTISNLFINRTSGWDANFVGFFGGTYITAVVKNLYLKDVNIVGSSYVGAFAGNFYGTADKCHSSGKVAGIVSRVGGFCGKRNSVGATTNCYSDVNVTMGWSNGGGFCGENFGSITNCYSTGKVSGSSSRGFCGYVWGDNVIFIGCHYDSQTSGKSDTGKGDPNTTADMKKQATFAGWDFNSIWSIKEDVSYPYFGTKFTLTASSTSGGSVNMPGEGIYYYDSGTEVNIVGVANTNYHFVNWTGTAVTAGKVANPNSPSTTVMMDANYAIQANFAIDQKIISGYVTEPDANIPVIGVSIDATNGGGSDTTDVNGYYEVLVDYNWSGRVMPYKSSYAFQPGSRTYVNVVQDIEDQNYVGALSAYKITGYIKNSCQVPIKGIYVEANNGGGSYITDVNGYYKVWVGYNWSGTVTLSKVHYTFEPTGRAYTNVLEDQTDQNYVATNIYDLDCSGSIGFGDVAIISENWLLTGENIPGDFYKDATNTVNFLDFADFADAWQD